MINSDSEIAAMRVACRNAARLLRHLKTLVKPGISTLDLDNAARDYCAERGITSATLNYRGSGTVPFPAHICTSVNEVVCHGIPDETLLRDGDIINIDVTTITEGYHGDTSDTVLVGRVSAEHERLVQYTRNAMHVGIKKAVPGNTVGDIGHSISQYAAENGLSIIREFAGHGINKKFHTNPIIPHHGFPGSGLKLKLGMIFTIEPILTAGNPSILFRNAWEPVTADGSYTAQAEHTILITAGEPEILTI